MPPLASSTISIQAALVSLPSRTVLHTKTKTSSSPVSSCSPTRPSSLRQTPPGRAPCRLGSCQGEPGRAFLVCTSEERRLASTWVKLSKSCSHHNGHSPKLLLGILNRCFWINLKHFKWIEIPEIIISPFILYRLTEMCSKACISKKIAQPICVAWSK